ncbi:MAG: epoxyqueuosine reductase [Dehalococcoidales bacterium]|nr:epoxyqueuosine reductase [Dehalococcoidales bacterium]
MKTRLSEKTEHEESPALTGEVTAWLKAGGASLVGVANVGRFDDSPTGHHPCDFVPGARSVVAFGVALLHQALYWEGYLAGSEFVLEKNRKDVLQNYFYRQTGYAMVNNLLDMLALRLANLLESRGYRSLFFPATYGTTVIWSFVKQKIPSRAGLFSQRHAAVRAGLGEFGLNNLVLTPEYGPRIRFNSVITEAALAPSPLLEEKLCLGEKCAICLEKCPGAISLRAGFDPEAVWYDAPVATDTDACVKLSGEHYCLGRCLKVCPVARKKAVVD